MLTRRGCFKYVAVAGVAWIGSGHAAYRQWIVYRSERLMIVAGRMEPEAFPLTKSLADDLRVTIPEARAEATRTPTLRHITRLLSSRQIEVAVVTEEQAGTMARGEGEASRDGPVPLRVVAFLAAPYVLICHAEFQRDQVYLMLYGLLDERASGMVREGLTTLGPAAARANGLRIPLHIGAREYLLEPERPPKPVEEE